MTIIPFFGGYIAYQGTYITCAPTRMICITRVLTWLMLDKRDNASQDYPLGGMIEPYDIEREREICR